MTKGARAADVQREEGLASWTRQAVLPFEPRRGYHVTLTRVATAELPERALLSVKGAPEVLLLRCTQRRTSRGLVALTPDHRQQLAKELHRLGQRGYRILAVAEHTFSQPHHELTDRDVTELTFLGFLALSDPVRASAGPSVVQLQDAGVQVLMITGDHPSTAEAIAAELEVLNGRRVVTGAELDTLDDDALAALLPQVAVVARGTPAHKVRVVDAFRRRGKVVAMTGDGANDAPAIRLADIGIALGKRATPAARAAADVVVTDDRLETILDVLVEGRAMWASVRTALGILVGGNLGEIVFTLVGAGVTGRSPLSARQLLLVNLLTDLTPALAVALQPPDPQASDALLREGPERSLGAALNSEIAVRATTTATAATTAWTLARLTGRRRRADTVGLAALVGTQLGQTLLAGGHSPAVVLSSLASTAVLATVIQTPRVSQLFGCTPLGPVGWTIAAAASVATTIGSVGLSPLVERLTSPATAVGAALPAVLDAVRRAPRVNLPTHNRKPTPTSPS